MISPTRTVPTLLVLQLAVLLSIVATTAPSPARANSCNGFVFMDLITGTPFLVPGTAPSNEGTVMLSLGTGSMVGASQMTINRVRYELDCNANFPVGIPCTDQGDIFSYEGDSTIVAGGTNCSGVTWTGGMNGTNEIVFTPSPAITLPPNTDPASNACTMSFKVRLDNFEPTTGPTSDSTPMSIEVAAGWSSATDDALCNNGLGSEA